MDEVPFTVTAHVCQPWFDFLRDGSKTVEGRLDKEKPSSEAKSFSDLADGDIIRFLNNDQGFDDYAYVRVIKTVRYGSFEEYLLTEGLTATLPGVTSLEDGVAVYRQFYTAEQEAAQGVLAVHVRPYLP